MSNSSRYARGFGLIILILLFATSGVMHFVARETYASALPPNWPLRREAVAVSGFFEILGALGLCMPSARRAAGIGLFLLTVAVTPANVYMYLRADLFPQVSTALLFWRLPLQLLLLALIWRVAIKPAHEMGHCANALSALSKRRASENPCRPEGQ
jgi:uncharacterized membrane protein